MRTDHQKLNATHESGMKDEAKDIENDRQLEAPSRQGHESKKSGQGHVLRRDGDGRAKGSSGDNS